MLAPHSCKQQTVQLTDRSDDFFHCGLAAAQCIVIGPDSLGVCYHNNLKLHALILTKLGL